MVLILFVQVLKVLSLKFELKNPAETLVIFIDIND